VLYQTKQHTALLTVIGCFRFVYMLATGRSCITKHFSGKWWCTYSLRLHSL